MPTAQATAMMELTGRLTGNAHAAQRPVGHDGQFAPTLCFEIECLGVPRICQVEQHFAQGQQAICEATAKSLRKGAVVRFQVPAHKLQVRAYGVSPVQIVSQPAKESTLF